MEILINDRRKIFTICKDFNNQFPSLKLEFHVKSSHSSGAASKKVIKSESKKIGQCRTVHKDGTISISPNMTINELKQNFSGIYGLSVKISAKSGGSWIEPVGANKFSLDEQNRKANSSQTEF